MKWMLKLQKSLLNFTSESTLTKSNTECSQKGWWVHHFNRLSFCLLFRHLFTHQSFPHSLLHHLPFLIICRSLSFLSLSALNSQPYHFVILRKYRIRHHRNVIDLLDWTLIHQSMHLVVVLMRLWLEFSDVFIFCCLVYILSG